MPNPATTEVTCAMAVLEQLYAPLVKTLNLMPEQSRRFYQLILDNKMRGQAQMAELLRHEDPGRMARTVAEFQRETDASLRALLGAADFARYEEYQTSIGDRGILERTKGDFAESPLTEGQRQSLLKAMESGRKAFGDPGGAMGFSVADTSNVVNEKLSRQESIDQHVLQLAAGFLSPLQLKILGLAQDRMMNARRSGYAKARVMFRERGQKR
jgi:hypothetical protein